MQLNVIGKQLITNPLSNILTQGEKNVDVVTIILPKMYQNTDLSEFTFQMRAASQKDTLTIQTLEKEMDEDTFRLIWIVTDDFTAVSGAVSLELVGTLQDKIIKFHGEDITVKENILGSYAPSPDILEQVLSEIQQNVSKVHEVSETMRIEYDVQEKQVGFKHANESEYVYTADLTGPQGPQGEPGTGDMQSLEWVENNAIKPSKLPEIGGTNLLRNSGWWSGTEGWSLGTQPAWNLDTATKLDGCNSLRITRSGLTVDTPIYLWPLTNVRTKVRPGEKICFSISLKTDNPAVIDRPVSLALRYGQADGTYISRPMKAVQIGTSWKKFVLQDTAPDDILLDNVAAQVEVLRNGTLWAVCPQLERGGIATDYSPSPYDLGAVEAASVVAGSGFTIAHQRLQKVNIGTGRFIASVTVAVTGSVSSSGVSTLAWIPAGFRPAEPQWPNVTTNFEIDYTADNYCYINQATGAVQLNMKTPSSGYAQITITYLI